MTRALVLCVCMAACSASAKLVHEPAAKPSARAIHPAADAKECVEMYGSCTEPPDQLCTSNALVIECGESAALPSTGERLSCVCP